MKKLLFIVILLLFPALIFSQKNKQELQKAIRQINTYGDVYFKLPIKDKSELKELPVFISIDSRSIKGHYIKAYVSKKHFQDLLNLHLNFEVIPKKKTDRKSLTMANTVSQMAGWNRYPTYSVYVQMMQNFANNYPGLTVLDTIGYSQNQHLVLALKITDNPQTDEDEPAFFYSAQMHGDELIGQVLMLRLIDYLLSNYNSDPQVKELVDNVEIWINPLANPDGLYNGTDDDVSFATRYLYNWVDANRNFPAPTSAHPDGENYAQETLDMMQFMDEHHFNLSSNIHSGAEVVSYPWDTWDTSTNIFPDDDWWVYVGSEYANTVFNSSNNNGYFTDITPTGIIEGGDWYVIEGSRQDYIIYFKNGREMTLELSSDKMLDAQLLPQYWNYNYQALLKYIKQSLNGLRGIVTDADTGEPIEAKIEIYNHDRDNSFVYSYLPVGDYHRYLKAGNYNVTFSKPGYISQTINVQITDDDIVVQNVALQRTTGIDKYTLEKNLNIFPNPVKNQLVNIQSSIDIKTLDITFYDNTGANLGGFNNLQLSSNHPIQIPLTHLSPGVYFIKLTTQHNNIFKKIVIE